MAGLRARRAGSLSGQMLSRRQSRTVFRPVAIEDGGTVSEEPVAMLPDIAERMATIAERINAPVSAPVGPLGRTSRTISLRLDSERHQALHMASRATGFSQQQLVLAAIDLWLSARTGAPQSVPTGRSPFIPEGTA